MLTAYRALIPGTALLCSLIAFILGLCCLLASTNPSTLPNMELYTLNASKIAPTLLREMHLPQSNASLNISTLLPRADLDSALSSAEEGLSNIGDDLTGSLTDLAKNPKAAVDSIKNNITQSVDEAKQEVSDAISKAESAVKNATGQIVGSFINETIQSFHIHDFYVGHLLTYCEGNYTAKGKEKLTYCSNGKPNNKYNKNMTTNGTLAKEDDNPLNFVKNLHLPDPIEYGFKALTLLTKIISAFFIVGLIALFFSLVSTAMTIPLYFAPPTSSVGGGESKQTILRWATLASIGCAFFTLVLASTMVHFLCKKLCDLVNDHPGLGVAMYPGNTFQGCAWAAVIFAGIGMMLAVGDVAVGLVGRSARNKLDGATRRKWWGRNKREEKEYEI
ncbi:MAG: hypothetical protein L6R41_000587 [Letrouitia leprolyta]|nr:MAG: hypothetical protein L6R41_000587 [Letrouitia leprolyta]